MAKVMLVGSFARSLVNFRWELMESLVARGHEVTACASDSDASTREQIASLGIRYVDIPLARTSLNPLRDLKTLAALLAVFRQVRPDIVLLYTIKPVLYGSLCACLARVPNVSSIITGLGYTFTEGSRAKRILTYAVRCLYRLSFRCNKVVFFQNVDDWRLFEKFKILNGRHLPVLINGSGVNTVQYGYRTPPPEVSFLMISRLLSEKGVREYAVAAEQLRRKYPEVPFRLVGFIDSSPRSIRSDELQGWVDSGSIVFLGKLLDVRSVLSQSSVFVLPSYYREGVPRTILEALSVGRPIITTDTPGCRETVRNAINGYLVPPRDVTRLVEAMETFILHPEMIPRMGQASRSMAVEKFDVHQVNGMILNSLSLG